MYLYAASKAWQFTMYSSTAADDVCRHNGLHLIMHWYHTNGLYQTPNLKAMADKTVSVNGFR